MLDGDRGAVCCRHETGWRTSLRYLSSAAGLAARLDSAADEVMLSAVEGRRLAPRSSGASSVLWEVDGLRIGGVQ